MSYFQKSLFILVTLIVSATLAQAAESKKVPDAATNDRHGKDPPPPPNEHPKAGGGQQQSGQKMNK